MGRHLPEMIRFHARERGDRPALSADGYTANYAELDRRTNRLGQALLAAAPAQARIGSLLSSRPESPEVVIACGKNGQVAVPLNWRLAAPELAAVAQDAGLRVLVTEPQFLTLAQAAAEAVPGLLLVVTGERPGEPSDYESFVSSGAHADPGQGTDPDAVCLQLYTSGTTGVPKGVLIHHDAFWTSEETAAAYGWDADSVTVNCLPMFHIAGTGWLASALTAGAHTILLREFRPAQVAELMERQRTTHAFFVPAMLQMMTSLPDIDGRDFSAMRTVVYGASPITPAQLRRALAVFGCHFMQKYGLTETVGSTTYLRAEDHDPQGSRDHLLKSAGRALPGVELAIADPLTGKPVAPGVVGEIRTRSRHNTRGYWNRPEETAALLTEDGWLRTGDAGYLDEEGYLFITDRIKDMVVTGGENVYPIEVESVLAEHPAVADVAVIGLPHEKWGEEVTAVVVLRAGVDAPSTEELIEFTRDRIASYKKPRRVFVVDELPRTQTGKILKRDLRRTLS